MNANIQTKRKIIMENGKLKTSENSYSIKTFIALG